jgi:branched-chain amino acid transport system permease protein
VPGFLEELLRGYQSAVVFVGINGILAFSMYAVLIAGQLSLAQAGFASIAAYTSAVLTMEAGLPFPVVLVIGMAVAAGAALLLGLPVLRLRGVFLAIATIGFGEVVRITALNLDVTGGAIGLRPIPRLTQLWHVYLALGTCAYLFWRMRPSRLGRSLAALKEDEVAARAMGIDTVRVKLFAFTLSGALAGLAGALFAHYARFISPGEFGFERAVETLLFAIVGGLGHWLGPILGGGFLTLLPELQRELGIEAGWLRPALNGTLLLLVILFLPSGLVGVGRRIVPAGLRHRLDVSSVQPADGPTERAPEPAEIPAVAGDAPAVAVLSGVGKDYGGVHALRDVSCAIRSGEILGLIGPNGAGKTTLVNVLTGLTAATSGTVVVGDTDIGGLTADRVNALGVSRTFQQTKLFANLSAIENVMVGGHRVAVATFLARLAFLPWTRRREREHAARADRCLALVGLAGQSGAPAASLSYGDRRRLEIARGLCAEPDLLVLDEPAAGMNHVEAAALGTLIRQVAALGVTVLLIEHNVGLVMDTCTRVVVLNFGEVIADGAPATVARDPEVVRAYLGDAAGRPDHAEHGGPE